MKQTSHSKHPYLLAVAAVGAAMLLRLPFWTLFGNEYPYLTFYPAVIVAAYRGGKKGGLAATLLSALAILFFFLKPVMTFGAKGAAEVFSLLYYAALAIAITWLAEEVSVARAATERQRQRTYQTLSSIGDGVISTDERGKIRFINPVAEQLTGWGLEEARGRDIHEVFRIRNEETHAPAENPIDRVLREGVICGLANHAELIAKDGTPTPIDDSGAPVRDEDGSIIGGVLVFRSMVERRQMEARLRDREQRLSRLAESNVVGILFGDIHGGIRDANDELLRMIGRTREELLAGKISWLDITPPEHLPADERALAEARERGACTPYEKEYFRSDGTRVPILVGYVLLGQERVESVALIVDLSARKDAERRTREANEELQHFTFGASHDLKEPLRMVSMYAQLLERRYAGQLGDEGEEYLRFIREGSDRMRALVDAILDYARAGDVRRKNVQVVNTARALDEALVALRGVIETTGATVARTSELPDVVADPVHVAQLFQNLIGNAVNYRSEQPPRIEIEAAVHDGMATFAIRDNGIGIPPEFHERIFGLFQRLHGRDRDGTGLGLPTCKRIVELYDGKLWVESAGEGQGSTFRFTLPVAAARAAAD